MRYRHLALSLVPALLSLAAEAGAVASAELYQNQAYTYGRFEARVRFAAGDGVISSFFLWKPGSELPGTFWNELDFEKLGADCRLQTNPLYGLPVVDHSQIATLDADLCGEYHTYTFEWTPSYIAYLVDGVEVRRDGEDAASAFVENAAAGMQIHFNIWPGDATFGGNFDAASLPVQQFISWVQYSSFDAGAFTLEWREEFDGAALPSGWAVGNWPSPKNLSTHQPVNVGFTSGLAALSLTADEATGFNGSPPPDVGGSAPGPDPSAGAGGEPGTGGNADIPAVGGAAPGAGSGGAASTAGVAGSASGPSGEAAGATGTSTPGTSTPGTSAPPAASSSGGCSQVASAGSCSHGVAWLTLVGVAWMVQRRRCWSEKGRGVFRGPRV